MVDWQIRQTHFKYNIVKKSRPPIPDGSGKFLVSSLVQLPHSFLYHFFSRHKLKLTRLLVFQRIAVARVVNRTCVVTWCQKR